MSTWLISIEGTPTGQNLALALALLAAFLHALFGALQKGRYDPWLSRGAIDASYCLLALPFALFVVPRPDAYGWSLLAGAFVIHLAYKLLQAMAYSRGAYTVVYPVVRGTGPLVTIIGAALIFGERFTNGQWLGVGVLMAGIFGLAAYNLRHLQEQRQTLAPALFLSLATGIFVGLYTTYDAFGIRATPDPFTFLAWFFVIDGASMPFVAAYRWHNMQHRPPLRPLVLKGLLGGVAGLFSFGSVMMATRLDKVGEAAVLRETSTVFAALLGWLMLGERVGPHRTALMTLIALGAILVELF